MAPRYGLAAKEEEEEDDMDLWEPSDEKDQLEGSSQRGTPATYNSGIKPELGRLLRSPSTMTLSCASILQKVNTGEIDLNPIWQRDVVWTAAKQSAIIDSFFRHYYVPPVLYSERHTAEGEVCFICIDGKQRISSICNFMNNVIPIQEVGTGKKYWYEEDRVAGKYPAIDRKLRMRFDTLQVHGFLYSDLADQEERDMFARVQMGSVLTPAEKLAAKTGAWSEWWRSLVKMYFDNPQLNVQHIITMARGKDWLFAAQITLFIYNWGITTYIPNPPNITKHLDNYLHSSPDTSFKTQVESVFATFVALCNHETYAMPLLPVKVKGLSAKSLAPIEFVFVPVLIWKYPDASLADLSRLVERMKHDVRKEFKDVMFNTRVAGFLKLWVESADAPGRKRRAAAQDIDDDGDYHPNGRADAGTSRSAPRPRTSNNRASGAVFRD